MPLPSPRDGEDRATFIARFMASDAMQREYSSQKQRLAIAYDQWRAAGHSAPRKSVLKRYQG